MFHVRGGTGAVPFILDVCQRLGIDAWDISEGQPLRAESGRQSQLGWESYREKVVGNQATVSRRSQWWSRGRSR